MKIIEKILSENLPIDNDTFIFDIETTGLNPRFCKIILIGILYNCQDKTIIKQFFAENEDEEKELLSTFVDEIKCFKSHVTYNGLGFDIGFINYRLKKHNIDFTLNKEDVKRSYNFKCDSQEVKDYLSGLTLKGNNQKGYGVIFVDGYPLSFYKESNNQVKNLYPKGLRR